MDFVIQWVWYLLAYLAGSLVAWAVAVVTIKHASEEAARADLSTAPESGAVK
ncbi:MAG: putative rane protein ArfB [Mycobacterium sp.]|jgi:uncharacterized membrane protein ArfB|nr:putative rane protein ArfB [Mycobacterium sp.]